jgi:hypothetical protein
VRRTSWVSSTASELPLTWKFGRSDIGDMKDIKEQCLEVESDATEVVFYANPKIRNEISN